MDSESLAALITQAEQLRQIGWRHEEIHRLFVQHFDLLHGQLGQNPELLIGLLGLTRIQHVDANSQMKPAPMVDRLEIYKRRIIPVEEFYDKINLQEAPSHTITGEPIYWLGEITQDRANSQIILGDPTKASALLTQGIIETSRLLQAQGSPDQLPPGILSSLGVLLYRRGHLEKNLPDLYAANALVLHADTHSSNPHRLATVSSRLLAASLRPDYSGTLALRLSCLNSGLKGCIRALIHDPKATVRSISQFLRESSLR